jgi:hypothetical protein
MLINSPLSLAGHITRRVMRMCMGDNEITPAELRINSIWQLMNLPLGLQVYAHTYKYTYIHIYTLCLPFSYHPLTYIHNTYTYRDG